MLKQKLIIKEMDREIDYLRNACGSANALIYRIQEMLEKLIDELEWDSSHDGGCPSDCPCLDTYSRRNGRLELARGLQMYIEAGKSVLEEEEEEES